MQKKPAQNRQLAFWACVTVWGMFQESLLGMELHGGNLQGTVLGGIAWEIFVEKFSERRRVNFSQGNVQGEYLGCLTNTHARMHSLHAVVVVHC